MISIVSISLENEMDLVLAHKRSMQVAERIGLTTATQTTFATAVSEIARTVIEHTDMGNVVIGLDQYKQRYGLFAYFTFDKNIRFSEADQGYYYAQKLVPEFNAGFTDEESFIEMKIGIPRSIKLDRSKTDLIQTFFANAAPLNAYEEIKKRNDSLSKIAVEQEEEIRQSKLIDEKKTEFISVASHEIKTPLTVLKAYSQLLMGAKDESSGRVKDIAEKIDWQSRKLLALVNQLLDISKIENGNLSYDFEPIDLSPFIEEMLSVMRQIHPGHEMTRAESDPFFVHIDKLRMEQVFTNLLGNAAKYSAQQTTISINTAKHEEAFVKISVTDRGIGMSAKSAESIFNKFYRSDDVLKSHSGLGVGLFIASKIVTDHGGAIWVESEEGAGSTFHFTIPLSKDPA